MQLVVFIIVTIILSSRALVSQAIGITVQPDEIIINSVAKNAQSYFTISNPSSEVALYNVSSDDFVNLIKLQPSSFILESGEKREIKIETDFKKEGRYKTNISIVAQPISERAFKAGTGFKIPLEIIIEKDKENFIFSIFHQHWENIIWGIYIIAIIALVKLFSIEIRKRILIKEKSSDL